jgi:peptidyl-prolyl cis-trans isomerase SurA
MVCDRIAPETDLPDREMVRRRLLEARAELMSRRYLRDLRRIAYVDIRI